MSETIMLSPITTLHICSGNHVLSAKEGPKISFFPNQNWVAKGEYSVWNNENVSSQVASKVARASTWTCSDPTSGYCLDGPFVNFFLLHGTVLGPT